MNPIPLEIQNPKLYDILLRRMDQYLKSKQPIIKNKIGRNEKCSCGSGKKYKKCCEVL